MESVQRALDESRGAVSALHEPLHLAFAHGAEEVAGRMGASWTWTRPSQCRRPGRRRCSGSLARRS
jgi:hypothetical protein